MSIGPFNLVANGTDNLVFSATDNWVVDQEVSSMNTWKITPAFDTTLFDIPGDIAIWYSVGGGAFAESTEPDHSLTVEITSNTTVIAKMAYSGTGGDITSSTGTNLTTTTQQSVNLTAGPSTTIGTVTVTGSAAPTEGVAESYSVAFDGDATDATYLWTTTDGSATIATPTAATTDITFSTSGSFTVTCTVSSATASDSPASDDLAVTVAAAGDTVTDTYTDSGGAFWSGGTNNFWTGLTGGTWASSGGTSNANAYVAVTSTCQIRLEGIELDNTQVPASDLALGDYVDVSIGSGTVVRATYNGVSSGGDALFEWNEGTATVAELEENGTWGWAESETVIILYYDASAQ